MRRKSRIAILIGLSAALVAGPAATAGADGLPLPVEDTGPTGVADADGVYRYVSLDAGADTMIERTVQNGGAVSRSTILRGDFTIPAVGIDGSASGLSADGSTLVLIRPRPSFPRRTTELVVLDAERLRVRDRVSLDGDFSFDAISPDGATMYLIEYTSPRDLTQYDVRAYDLERGRLVPGAIVDPNESGDEMYGIALSRATSPSGRWAYTLYWGNEKPFVHALDTVRGRAVCIDLDPLAGVSDMSALDFPGPEAGSPLVVNRRGEPAALIDTTTFEVTTPAPAEPPATLDEGSAWPLWTVVGGGAAVILAAAAGLALRRRRNGPLHASELERLGDAELGSLADDRPEERTKECDPVP